MAKEKKKAASKRDFFQVKDGKIERTKRHCPKCGPGTFMAQHKDRTSCGKCGYTEFANKR